FALPVFFGATDVSAQGKKEVARANFERGQMLYQAGKYLQAIKAMKEAYSAIPKPIILFYIAEIYKDADLKEEAVTYYRKYLNESRINDTTGIRKRAEDALKKLGASTKAADPGVVTVVRTPVKDPQKNPVDPVKKPVKNRRKFKKGELIHTPLEEAQPNRPARLDVELPEDIKRAWLYVYYRKPGQEKYTRVKMKVDKNDIYFHILPCSAFSGSILQYYIEAIGVTGKKIAGSGKASDPLLVEISTKNPLQPGGKMSCAQASGTGVYVPPEDGSTAGTTIPKNGDDKTPKRKKSFYFALGTTAATGALIAVSVAMGFLAQSQATSLEDSQMSFNADGKVSSVYPPTSRYSSGLVPFSGDISDYASKGASYQTTMFIAGGFATLAAAASVYFWLDYLDALPESISFDARFSDNAKASSGFSITPILGEGTVGVGTSFRF
ncbi:MAG: tetratricopeptide repeat protein, partial [Deltaproteobacteria bacterium]|nr:tetratricopeptide repeat protein [Deltaproteobacteria bacterium]